MTPETSAIWAKVETGEPHDRKDGVWRNRVGFRPMNANVYRVAGERFDMRNDATGDSGTTCCSPAAHEGPILFSGEMVNAILDDRKTQTRRAIDRMKGFRCKQFGPSDTKGYDWHFRCQRGLWQDMDHDEVISRCPYGQAGDRLWVRETWRVHGVYHDKPTRWVTSHQLDVETDLAYAADEYEGEHKGEYRPSIFMPRWASRITLEIINVRVERLQDISRGDCMAEGCPFQNIAGETDPIEWFAELWERINHNWDANPWLWVVEFRRV